jgi:hypothetical protein
MSTIPAGETDVAFSHLSHIEQLGWRYRSLVQALVQGGLDGVEAAGLLERSLSARCTLCGITINGSELSKAVVEGATAGASDSKIARLRNGYCARKGCASYHYDLLLRRVDGVCWQVVWSDAQNVQPAAPARDEEKSPPAKVLRSAVTQLRRSRKVMMFVLVAIALLTLIYVKLRSPSWSTGPYRYRLDTNSALGVSPAPVSSQ